MRDSTRSLTTKNLCCLESTRVQILQDIGNSANDPEGPYIYWMSGLAGSGKSTIAHSVARTYDGKNRLGASFFFSIHHCDTRRATGFVTTIARRLADADASLRHEISQAVDRRRDISSYSLDNQWRRLILDPLARFSPEAASGIATIVRLFTQSQTLQSGKLRVFLTGRADTRIEARFYAIPEDKRRCFKLHGIDEEVVDHDIGIFFKYRFRSIAKYHGQNEDWSGIETINILTQKAGGLFIWAATAFKFVGSDSRFSKERLAQLLDGHIPIDDPKSELDKLYLTVPRSTVLVRHTAEERIFIYNFVRQVLGTMAVAVSPLPVAHLGRLFQSEARSGRSRRPGFQAISTPEIYLNLRNLSAIVDPPDYCHQCLRLHHTTLRGFLLDDGRFTEQAFHVSKRQTHLTLAGCCVNVMSQSWECCPRGRGIFGLDNPGVAVADLSRKVLEQWLPADLQYACL